MEKGVPKLVRDNDPTVMRAKGVRFMEHEASGEELRGYLFRKPLEEAGEVVEAMNSRAKTIEEIGDLLDTVDAILEFDGIDMEKVEASRLAKRTSRGCFSKGKIVETY